MPQRTKKASEMLRIGNMKKYISFILLFLFSLPVFAGSLEISVDPLEPLKGESFFVTIKVKNISDENPMISFDPRNVTVLGRENRGVSVRTTIINGRLSTEREIIYAYEMMADHSGRARLENIQVEAGGQTIKHKNISIKILNAPKKKPEILARVEVNKDEIYVGEGITANYYLYNRIPIVGYDIKTFPKLDKFLKRFNQVTDNAERVEFMGEVYERRLIYSAKLFAEKAGKLRLDPIRLRVQYATRSSRNDPFAALGFGLSRRSVRVKSVSSKVQDLKVVSLPTEGLKKHFTGLVGKHSFDIEVNKSKFLVNDPIEIKFEVRGPGALEFYELRNLYQHPNLEEFEGKSDLRLQEGGDAIKSFDFTYLPRGPLKLGGKTIKFSYFDSDTKSYEDISINLPAITADGSGNYASKNSEPKVDESEQEEDSEDEKPVTPIVNKKREIISPIFNNESMRVNWFNLINYSLSVLALFLIGFLIRSKVKGIRAGSEFTKLVDEMKKSGVSYSRLFKLLKQFDQVDLSRVSGNRELKDILSSLDLSPESREYFEALVDSCEKQNYLEGQDVVGADFDPKHFKELEKLYANF